MEKRDREVSNDVIAELSLARSLHKDLNSAHEAYAVIKEELDEFWAEVMKKRSVRSKEQMGQELIQVAAMAIRAVVDLGLEVGSDPCPVCGNEERTISGFLTCECPATRTA